MFRNVTIFLILLTGGYNFSHAETITLKNGDAFESPILEKTSQWIKVNRFDVKVTYFNDEVASISTIPLPKPDQITPASVPDLNEFVLKVSAMDDEVGAYLDQHSDHLNQLKGEEQKSKAMNVVLQETKFLNDQIQNIKQMPTPPEAMSLKDLMLSYYQSMVEVQAAALKFLIQSPDAEQLVQQKTASMTTLEGQFQAELNRLRSST